MTFQPSASRDRLSFVFFENIFLRCQYGKSKLDYRKTRVLCEKHLHAVSRQMVESFGT
jgi:hypothetical protein